ncbi:MAG: outer membrane protein assembly factor BamD [Verrucomicrobia bacterium]|nr:outer membrane protein assembly factor BamD [Verrucomicrobiota bacterium]
MRPPSVRALRFLVLLLSLFGLFATASRADLVWTKDTGWRVEGGALAGLSGADGRKALDLMNEARTKEENGSRRSAIKAYANVAKKYPNSIYAPEALYRSARLRLAGRDFQKAFEDYQAVVGRYPNTKRFNEIIGEQYRIASALLDGARGRMLWGLLPGFTARDKALEFFETILANAPYSDYAPLSLMNIARGHQKLKQDEDAIDALDRMINNYPQSLLAPDAYLKLGQTHATLVDGPYYDQAATKEAITYFTDFMLLFPSDAGVAAAEKGLDSMKTMLAESKMKIGDFYFYKRDNYTAAKVFYNEAITSYPESPIAARAKVRLAAVEAKASGKKAPDGTPEAPKKKRFWLF